MKKDKKCLICDKEQPEHEIYDAILCHNIYICEQCYNIRELYIEKMKLNTEKYWKEQKEVIREWRDVVKI